MAQSTQAADAAPKPGWRLGLFLPYLLLVLVVLGWSVGWFWVRGKAEAGMDAWLAREAAAGRNWTCADRSIGGFPFRLELSCTSLAFKRADGSFTLGPVTAVVQVYQPRHVIAQLTGPFHVEQGDLIGDVTWQMLKASVQGKSDGFTLASLVVDQPKGSVTGGEPGTIDFSAEHIELHARPTPGRFENEGAVDVSLRTRKTTIPQLDAVSGSPEPANIGLDTTIVKGAVLRSGRIEKELEKWRLADGKLELTLLSLVKGAQRLQGSGTVALDETHRPTGQIDLRAGGLDALLGRILGQRGGDPRLAEPKGGLLGNLIGLALDASQKKNKTGQADDGLKTIPSVAFADGQVFVVLPKPLPRFPIPNLVVPPLY